MPSNNSLKRPAGRDITSFFTPAAKRSALAPLPVNARESASASASASPASASASPASPSRTMEELRRVTPALAADTLDRLVRGYADKSGASYPAAVANANGCVLAQKGTNRKDNGYVQITPISTRTRAGTSNGSVATKPQPQGAHRLVVIAHGSDDDRYHLLHDGWHASHRCHEPTCIAPDHVVCEPKAANEKRKDCARLLWVLETKIGGVVRVVRSKFKCQCQPACVPRVLEAEEEEEQEE